MPISQHLAWCHLQVLATDTQQLQQLVDSLLGLGMTAEQMQEMIRP
jgi:hypothetical protein